MSKTILANVDGFTPIIDSMIPDVGLLTATIFGKVWRYCQMSDGVCKAGQERIADELGLTRPTINSHLSTLCEKGYLKDLTPTLAGVPHLYADTGKAGLSISFTASGQPVKQNDTPCKSALQVGVKEIYTKKELKKELKKESYIDPVISHMESIGMFANSNTRTLLLSWREKHTDEWIIRALEKSRGKNQNYADKILLGWEVDGYPKSRDEQIADRRKNSSTGKSTYFENAMAQLQRIAADSVQVGAD